MTKQDLIQLLTDNEIDRLFEQLKSRPHNPGEQVLLESQWKDLQSRQRIGTISSDQANIEAARLRQGLLEIIDLSFAKDQAPAGGNGTKRSNETFLAQRIGPFLTVRTMLYAASALIFLLLVFLLPTIVSPADQKGKTTDTLHDTAMNTDSNESLVHALKLNSSLASPITLAPGDFQYERVYKLIEGSVESIGGGQRLVTLKVGLDFKGIINHLLSTNDFRLVSDGLPGPLAPSNFLSKIIDSKSYGDGEVKFELSDTVKRFSVILEGKETKKWDFTIE